MSENYTDEMVQIIHKSWKKSVRHAKQGKGLISRELAEACGYYDTIDVSELPRMPTFRQKDEHRVRVKAGCILSTPSLCDQ